MTTERAINTGKLQQQDFMLSGSSEKAMQEMMLAIDKLRSIYVEETDALLAVDTMKFLQLQDQKIEAARNYQSGVEQIIKRKDEFRNSASTVREELKRKQEEFSTLACANLEALDRMTKTVRRLGERIMRTARETAAKNTPNYSANGSLNKNKRPVSIGINESA